MFIIDDIISELIAAGFETVKGKVERNERAVKILEKFKLKSDEPPEDFEGVYVYTLIEYGIGKPETLLKLFRHNTIKASFQEAFEQDNPYLLLEASADFVEEWALGDKLKEQNIDYRRELAEFSALFIEIAKRSRTPREVMRDRALQNLQSSLSTIRSQIEQLNLPQLQGEIAQLAQGYQALLPPAPARDSELAQQLRGWFEALHYDFERYENWGDEYFEWIINIPARRGFDRILVRGVEGEAGMRDFLALRQGVEAQKTDEGWLVAHRRISRAVRDELEKRENRHIFGYTFDELLDEAAKFDGYFQWLEEQVKSRKIDEIYVPLACTKEEVDPHTKQRLGVSRYDERDGWIDGYVDLWLADPAKEHLSVLGEFGTGKTWFVLHYAWTALQKYLEAKQRGIERPRIPLVIPLRDYAKAVNVESLFSEFIFRKHEIPIPNYSAFVQLNRMGKLLLIFDGFDEMAAKIDKQLTINNFWELARAIVPGTKAILTCRTEHFPEAKEGRRLLNAELQASTSALTGEPPQFEVLELDKFDDAQIQQVLSFRAKPETVEQVMGNPQLLDLARRPVMIDLILEALPEIEEGKPVDISRIYLYAVGRKMERDIKTERTFTSMADKLYFLCELSWEMLSNDQMSLNYREFPDRLRRLFGLQEQKDLDHWHYDMMGQTMLIRNAEGDYTPAHRSLLEFFVAYKFAAELGVLAEDFAEVVGIPPQSPLNKGGGQDSLNNRVGQDPREERQTNTDPTHYESSIAPLSKGGWGDRSLANLRDTFGLAPLPKAVLDLLLPMLDPGEGTKERLLEMIRATRGKTPDEVGYVGGNAATLLVKRDPSTLDGCDLSGCIVKGGDFVGASLRDANFAEANLAGSDFNTIFSSVLSVTFSPDGSFFATGDANGEIHLWQIDERRPFLVFQGHNNWIWSVAISPDGKTLASASADRTVKLWDIHTGKCRHTLLGHTTRVRSVAISSDSQTLASSSDDRTVKLWDVHTGKCLRTLHGHTDCLWSVEISANSQLVASASVDGVIKIWDIHTGECLKTLKGHSRWVRSVVISADNKILASGSYDQTIKLWDIETGQCIKTLQGHSRWIRSVAISADNKILASGSYDQTIKLWDIETGQCIKTLQEHSLGLTSVAFSPDGKTLASSGSDQTVKLWNIYSGKCVKTLQGHGNWISSLAVSSENQTLANTNEDQTITLWNIDTGECIKTLLGHTGWISSLAITADGQILASGSADRTVKIWDVCTGKCLKTFQGYTGTVLSVAFSPDGRTLASGSNKVVKLWNIQTGECVISLQESASFVWSVAFSPDGRTLASGSSDATVKIWDIYTGEKLRVLREHSGEVNSVAISANGITLVSGSNDTTIRTWNIQTGECLNILQGHTSSVRALAISPNGKRIVSSSSDKTLKLWDIYTGKCIKTFHGHTKWIKSVIFSADGRTLVSGGYDETIKIWDINTGECLKTLSNKPYADLNITEIQGLDDAEIATLKALGAVDNNS